MAYIIHKVAALSLAGLLIGIILASKPTSLLSAQTEVLSANAETLEVTLADLGSNTVTLSSPFAQQVIDLRLPAHWQPLANDNIIRLDFSYQFEALSRNASSPTNFGTFFVNINGITILEYVINRDTIARRYLEIPIPPEIFTDPTQQRFDIQLLLDANLLCDLPHQAELTIFSTSSITLNYQTAPVQTDLSEYPTPFFQRSQFVDNIVHVVVPDDVSSAEASELAGIVARLGDIAGSNLVISTTMASDFESNDQDLVNTLQNHLILAGTPTNTPLLRRLNQANQLQIPFYPRQLELSSSGPLTASQGSRLDYFHVLTNSLTQSINISVTSNIPPYTRFIDCIPSCDVNPDQRTITWRDETLEPGSFAEFAIKLQALQGITDVTHFDQTLTVFKSQQEPINGHSLYTTIAAEAVPLSQQTVVANAETPFFATADGAVPDQEGIVQFIPSPWNEAKALLILTGENTTGVTKATRAMRSTILYPELTGPVARIKDIRQAFENVPKYAINQTLSFQEMGYDHEILTGIGRQVTEYRFEVPYLWSFNEDLLLDLQFNHAQTIDFTRSNLSILLENIPVATIGLDSSTATQGRLTVPIPASFVQSGERNRLQMVVTLAPIDACSTTSSDANWFVINSASSVTFPSGQYANEIMDMARFLPLFTQNNTLETLLITLSEKPDKHDWNAAFAILQRIGSTVSGKTLHPQISLGTPLPPAELREKNIIAVGQPTQNAYISAANSNLPQPFVPDTNNIAVRYDDVDVRLSQNFELGLLQLIPSPWNEQQKFLAVTGTNPQGVALAVDFVVRRTPAMRDTLMFITDENVISLNANEYLPAGIAQQLIALIPDTAVIENETLTSTAAISDMAELLPESTPITRPTPSGVVDDLPPSAPSPAWLLPTVLIALVVVILTFSIGFWQFTQQRQRNRR